MKDTLYLQLVTQHRETVTRARREEQWDRDDTYTDWTIIGLRRVDEHQLWEFCTKTKQPRYWVVLEYYDTGDSFGKDENRMLPQHLALTRQGAEHIAAALCKSIQAHEYSCTVKDIETRKTLHFTNPSVGYFNCLRHMDIIEIDVLSGVM